MGMYDLKQLEEHFFLIKGQKVTVHDFEAHSNILDLGGGGEGIIGILKGEQVIAIDARKGELEEAADGPLKIVMDARDLQFLDGSFATVTAFFMLMYLKSKDAYEDVFAEVFRVLKPGGKFLIWDGCIPIRPVGEERDYLVLLVVTVGDRVVETGYGHPWPEEEHDLTFYIELGEKSGFHVVAQSENDRIFFLELQKPSTDQGA